MCMRMVWISSLPTGDVLADGSSSDEETALNAEMEPDGLGHPHSQWAIDQSCSH